MGLDFGYWYLFPISILIATTAMASGIGGAVFFAPLNIVAFTIPGVLVGGQIGPLIQARVNPHLVKTGIAILFVAAGLFMLSTVA